LNVAKNTNIKKRDNKMLIFLLRMPIY